MKVKNDLSKYFRFRPISKVDTYILYLIVYLKANNLGLKYKFSREKEY